MPFRPSRTPPPPQTPSGSKIARETSPLIPKSPTGRSRDLSPGNSSICSYSSCDEALTIAAWKRHIALASALTNCLFAGSVLIFSLWAPLFLRKMHYTQMQVNAISIGAEFGMYLPVPILGYISDQYGPNKLSAMSALFFSLGYALAATAWEASWKYQIMVGAFTLIGVGTASMYFSGVTACAKTFTGRRGLGLAAPIASFGLSSLWMTQLVCRKFVLENGDLAVERAFWFFSGSLFIVGIGGYFGLGIVGTDAKDTIQNLRDAIEDDGRWINADTRAFLMDRSMWGFATGFFLITGPGEAFINNMGTLIQTLRPTTTTVSNVDPALHVSLVALTSTIARLLAGTVSDYLAPPVPVISLPPITPVKKRFTLSRMNILFVFAALMFLGFTLVSSSFVYTHPTLFALVSSSIGAGYGAVFCLAPTVVSVVWGTKNFGTNWGFVTVTPAIGAVFYGSLFAAEYDGHSEGDDYSCVGPHCSRWSFTFMTVSVGVAMLLWLFVWRGASGFTRRGIIV